MKNYIKLLGLFFVFSIILTFSNAVVLADDTTPPTIRITPNGEYDTTPKDGDDDFTWTPYFVEPVSVRFTEDVVEGDNFQQIIATVKNLNYGYTNTFIGDTSINPSGGLCKVIKGTGPNPKSTLMWLYPPASKWVYSSSPIFVTITLPAGCVEDTAGNPFPSDYTFSFTALPYNGPPAVTTVSATVTGKTTANYVGNITNLGVPNPTEHGFVWGLAQNPTIISNNGITTKGVKSSTGLFSDNITGLAENTRYYVRAYATNTSGIVYGGQLTIDTADAPWLDNLSLTPSPIDGINTEVLSGDGNEIAEASYRIFYTTDDPAPGISYDENDMNTVPGAGWVDSTKIGTMNVSGNKKAITVDINGSEFNTVVWKHVTFKVWVRFTNGTQKIKISNAYPVIKSNVDTVGSVAHNQIITVGSTDVVASDPDTPVDFYGPYSNTIRNALRNQNVFADGDIVTYRLEFDVNDTNLAEDMIVTLDFNLLNEDGIELRPTSVWLVKFDSSGKIVTGDANGWIKCLKGGSDSEAFKADTVNSNQGINRYIIKLGKVDGQAILKKSGVGKYAILCSCILDVEPGTGTVGIINEAEMEVYQDDPNVDPYSSNIVEQLRPNRKMTIKTNISRESAVYYH